MLVSVLSAVLLASNGSVVAGTDSRTMDVELADLDGDGRAELVRAVEFEPNQVLHQGETGWVPSDRFLFPAGATDSEDIAIADFNGDGHPDIAIANEDTMVPELYFNRAGRGLEDMSARLDFRATANTVIAFDLDRDGDMDLVFGDAGPVVFAINDGAGNFRISRETHPGHSYPVQDLEAGDVDGDGDLDLVVASEGPNRILLNNNDGVFSVAASAFGEARYDEETREADFADIDGDGDLDVYFANVGFRTQSPGGARDRLLLNDGAGVFRDVSSDYLPDWSAHSLDVDFIDSDRDGDLDLLVAASFGGGLWAFENDGSGHFSNPRQLAEEAYNTLDVELLPDQRSLYVAGFGAPDRIVELEG
ncbi:VCBS repeat-containing protein [Maricaulis sp.]|uniref:FG-GAP repeat domain-containing protein n=1 Tax=Maricaulis sp. TaxID=1486257 RepID=UPI0026348AC9|nr:VCBS repeat-containing protein [Maricaulis sp.]